MSKTQPFDGMKNREVLKNFHPYLTESMVYQAISTYFRKDWNTEVASSDFEKFWDKKVMDLEDGTLTEEVAVQVFVNTPIAQSEGTTTETFSITMTDNANNGGNDPEQRLEVIIWRGDQFEAFQFLIDDAPNENEHLAWGQYAEDDPEAFEGDETAQHWN
jgi:hypothetical protein